MWHWLLWPFTLIVGFTSAEYEGRVVCYYKSDNVYRAEGYRMQPQEIDAELCTHVIYYSAFLHPHDAIVPSDLHVDLARGGYKKFVKLKEVNPELKVMLSLRGEPGEKDIWPLISSQKTTRNWFSILVVDFLRANKFDGLDIDWQIHSGKRNSDNYLYLLKDLRQRMDQDSVEYNAPRMELSVLLPAQIQQLHRHFLLANVSQYVDFINVATMDYWSLDPYTVQHHAPLYKNPSEGSLSPLNVDESIKYYLYKCVPPEKLVLGVPTYGRSFKLSDDRLYGLGSQCKYPGEKGFATNSPGTLAYFEICTYITEENWSVNNKNMSSIGPYAHHGSRWVGYDDARMISIKALYAIEKDLGGLMFWTIDQDDFRGYCGLKYPLIKAAKYTLSTGKSLDGTKTLEAEEKKCKFDQSQKNTGNGYIYPRPTIQQPGFTAHEVTIPYNPSASSSKPDTDSKYPSKIPDDGIALMNGRPATSTKSPEIPITTRRGLPFTTSPKPTTIGTVEEKPIKVPPPTKKPVLASTKNPGTRSPTTEPKTASKPADFVTAKPVTISPTAQTEMPSVAPGIIESNNLEPSTQSRPSNMFMPNIKPQSSSDSDPSTAITQLKKVLDTVNEIIANANAVNNAANNLPDNPTPKVTIEPWLVRTLETLLNTRNSARFTTQNTEQGKSSNSTIQIQSQVDRYPMANDLSGLASQQVFIPFSNNSIAGRNDNVSATVGMISDKAIFIGGRDIVSINLNVTVNNNFFQAP